MPAIPDALMLHPDDNVALLLRPAVAGETVTSKLNAGSDATVATVAREDIAKFHKIALQDIALHAPVRRSGMVIGLASAPIRRGDWVHVHNLKSQRARVPAPILHSHQSTE